MTSSAFDENPLSRKVYTLYYMHIHAHVHVHVCMCMIRVPLAQAGPTSVSTVFNESVLGPIHRETMAKRRPPQATAQATADGERISEGSDNRAESAFERMMSAFEAFGKTAVKPVEPLQDGSMEQLVTTNEGASKGAGMFGSEDDKDKSNGEGFGTQSRKWQEFINGSIEHPQPVYAAAVSPYTAVHVYTCTLYMYTHGMYEALVYIMHVHVIHCMLTSWMLHLSGHLHVYIHVLRTRNGKISPVGYTRTAQHQLMERLLVCIHTYMYIYT